MKGMKTMKSDFYETDLNHQDFEETASPKTKSKLGAVLKVAGVSVVAIGLFSAAFVGANTLAFNNATSHPTPIAVLDTSQGAFDYPAARVATPIVSTGNIDQGAFVMPNINVVASPFQHEAISEVAMSAEEAASFGAEYVWDAFGVSIEGHYVIMSYMNCWARPGRGRWQGSVALPGQLPQNSYFISPQGQARWEWGEVMFTFTVDSLTGERLDISYATPRSGHPMRIFEYDTHHLWESSTGRAIRQMDGYEIANFIGLAPEVIEAFREEATHLASAHFINSTIESVTLGFTIPNPGSVPLNMPGVHILLQADANREIFGTFEGIEFTATDAEGNQAIVSIMEWQGLRTVAVRTLHVMEARTLDIPRLSRSYSIEYFRTRTVPAHLQEVWAADDAEVSRRLDLNNRGVAADDMPYYGMHSRWELLESIERLTPIEMRHLEMSRDELVTRVHISLVIARADRMDTNNLLAWARENYDDAMIAIYEELGAPDWLVDSLRAVIR